MSAESLAASFTDVNKTMAVSFQFLLCLYAIVPICIVLQLLDQFYFDFAIRDKLPSSPSHFLLFQVLFGTPHIIASNLLLTFNREYFVTFKTKIVGMTVFIILFFGVGSLFIPYEVLYVITACWTVYHVLKQQHGIAKAVCGLPVKTFYLQLWLSVIAGILIYLGIFLKNSLSTEQAKLTLQLSAILCLLLLASTWHAQKYVDNRLGLYFLWANASLVFSSWYLYSQHFYFLAILIPRLVHDITAYSFYVSHDVNRQGRQADNSIYQLAKTCHFPVAMVLPVSSFILTYLFQAYGDDMVNFFMQTLFSTQIYKAVTLGLIGYLALMHYYTEAFVWSAGSPLRRYIRFAK